MLNRGPARRPARWAARILGVLALLLGSFLVSGLLLPSQVDVSRSVQIDAPAERIFPYLNDLDAWLHWTPWGDVASELRGPSSGEGAQRVWDDPRLGSGSLSLVRVVPNQQVDYLVEVEDGAIRFEGVLTVAPNERGSTLTWREIAVLGRNPLLRWIGLTMDRAQGQQMEESLARLKERAESD